MPAPKDPVARELWRARISEGNRRRYEDPAERARTSAANRGNKHSWRGDAVGYAAVHDRHRKVLPPECAHCGAPPNGKANDCALIHGRGTKRDADGRWYSPDPEDYVRLCPSHHHRYDRGLLEVA